MYFWYHRDSFNLLWNEYCKWNICKYRDAYYDAFHYDTKCTGSYS